jgi:hypothetical protein
VWFFLVKIFRRSLVVRVKEECGVLGRKGKSVKF